VLSTLTSGGIPEEVFPVILATLVIFQMFFINIVKEQEADNKELILCTLGISSAACCRSAT